MSEDIEYNFKIILVGEGGVGKSSLIRRYIHNKFDFDNPMTIGVNSEMKKLTLDGHSVMLHLWDTAGQEKFGLVTSQYVRGSHAAVLVYDITNQKSFQNLFRRWVDKLREWGTNNMVCMLIGNKADEEEKRQVTQELGVNKAKENNMLFLETSCLNCLNVEKAFQEIIGQMWNKNRIGTQNLNSVILGPRRGIQALDTEENLKKPKRRLC